MGGNGRVSLGVARVDVADLYDHNLDLALGLVESVICIAQGRVRVDGKPDAIRNNSKVQEVYLRALLLQ